MWYWWGTILLVGIFILRFAFAASFKTQRAVYKPWLRFKIWWKDQ